MLPRRVLESPAIAEDVLREASRIGDKVSDVVKDSVRVANLQFRRGRHAAEDILDDAKHTVKRKPFASVAVVFAAGFFFGSMFACAAMRQRYY
jgi:ElaB/YqjD/DUF883 family membrane-anchored ribosome-binding protein